MRSPITYGPTLANINRWFDSFFEDFARPVADCVVRKARPAIDVSANEGGYLLEAELPGRTKKDFEVKVDGNLLTLTSKQDSDETADRNGYVVHERPVSSFTRSFVLPKDVDADAIDANFKNGLLTLSIPKSEAAQPKQIEVKS